MNHIISSVNKQHFLDNSEGGFLFYKTILPDLKEKDSVSFENVLNPFYDDTNPGLSIYERDDKWLFKDHGDDSYKGDVFNFAAHYFELDVKEDFRKLLHRMYEVIGLAKIEHEKPVDEELIDLGFRLPGDRFSDNAGYAKAFEFYQKFGITEAVLRRFGVRAVSFYEYIDKKGVYRSWNCKNELVIAYASVNHAKIYRPDDLGFKFTHIGHKPDDFVFGQDEIVRDMCKTKKYLRELLIVTSGEKDVFTMTSLGYDAICLNSETGSVPKQLENSILNCYKHIIVLYDIDETGIINAKKLERRFGFKACTLPMELRDMGGKDVSDFMYHKLDVDVLRGLIVDAAKRKVRVQRKGKSLKDSYFTIDNGFVNSKGEYIKWPDSDIDLAQDCEEVEMLEDIKESVLPVCAIEENHTTAFCDIGDEVSLHIPRDLYSHLPVMLKDICDHFSDIREKDMLLLSSLTVISSLLPKIRSYNAQIEVGCNLNAIVCGPPSAGKGVNVWAKRLTKGVKKHLTEKYNQECTVFSESMRSFKNGDLAEEPIRPVLQNIVIPANNSVANIYKMLRNNDGRFGLIFETEIDTLAEVLKNDWGNFSDVLRKCFHHETISLARKSGEEFLEVERPHLSVFLTGTPGQVASLMPSVENGLFSRFVFYNLDSDLIWKSQFQCPDNRRELFFDDKARQLLNIWLAMESTEGTMVQFSNDQTRNVDHYFESKLHRLVEVYGGDIAASVKRMCLSWQRIAMILTALRSVEQQENLPSVLYVSDNDARVALTLVNVLLNHLKLIFESISRDSVKSTLNQQQYALWEMLGNEFTRQEYDQLLGNAKVVNKTGEKYLKDYISRGLLKRVRHAHYAKIR
jgi:hypothetical protein